MDQKLISQRWLNGNESVLVGRGDSTGGKLNRYALIASASSSVMYVYDA